MEKKRILIISDSHRHTENVEKAIKKSGPFDMLIHLGDIEDDTEKIKQSAGCPCYFVRGNCDLDYKLQECQIINLLPHRIFAVHGHKYAVRGDTFRLEYAASEVGCDIALFGHTHVPYFYDGRETEYKMVVLNPGSCSLPRQADGKKTYVVMTADEEGNLSFEFCHI